MTTRPNHEENDYQSHNEEQQMKESTRYTQDESSYHPQGDQHNSRGDAAPNDRTYQHTSLNPDLIWGR